MRCQRCPIFPVGIEAAAVILESGAFWLIQIAEADFGNHALEASALHAAGRGAAKIVINDADAECARRYVSWEKAEAIRKMVSSNVPTGQHHGAPKHGDAPRRADPLQALRAQADVGDTGAKHGIPRYSCSRAWMDSGAPHCIAFGGLTTLSRMRC